jgi:hypothetical protein
MPKGHKKNLDLRGGLQEMDRALAYAMRKNMATAERLLNSPIEESEKVGLRAYLEGHPLSRKQQSNPEPNPAPRIPTERERFLERVTRVLMDLSDPNLRNLYELAKSMGRVERSREQPSPPKVRRGNAEKKINEGSGPSGDVANGGD